MFTLSGGHVFPVYDGAVKADPPMPILDVRHEQTAVFAAEATARLTRTPGFAVLTAGPGVTNGISAITTAQFNGSGVVVLGGRAPSYRWGSGSLQEFDHPALLAPITAVAPSMGTAFIAGKNPMIVSGSWWYGRFASEMKANWDTFLFPGNTMTAGSSGNRSPGICSPGAFTRDLAAATAVAARATRWRRR